MAESSPTCGWLERGIYPLLVLIAAAGVWWLYVHDPVRYVNLIAEDHFGENFTAVAQILSALLLAGYVALPGLWRRRVVAALLAAACFFVAMEEISWGQRLLRYDTPEWFMAINHQGEMTLHNVTHVTEFYGLLGVMLLGWLAVSALPQRWRGWMDRLGVPPAGPMAWPWALIGAILALRLIPVVSWDELMELGLGIAVLMLALHLLLTHPRLPRWSRHGLLRVGAVAVVLVVCTLGSLTMLRLHMPWMGWRYARSALDYQNRRDMPEQALLIFEHIHDNPVLRTPDSAIRHAEVLVALEQPERAAQVLHEELEHLEEEDDAPPHPLDLLRRRVGIHRLLDEHAEADELEAQLMEQARARLQETDDPDEAASIQWVLAKAAFDQGHHDSAMELAAIAAHTAHRANLANEIDLWVRINLGRPVDTPDSDETTP